MLDLLMSLFVDYIELNKAYDNQCLEDNSKLFLVLVRVILRWSWGWSWREKGEEVYLIVNYIKIIGLVGERIRWYKRKCH